MAASVMRRCAKELSHVKEVRVVAPVLRSMDASMAMSVRASEAARPLAVEALRLLALPTAATREIKTHNEAHFIRLGVGRAVYAYRLAYGGLPESLETLVEAELMPARYLADENNTPLICRREEDAIIVESVGPQAWSYRLQGLDARR